MASKNRLGQAAETSVNGFFTNTEENKAYQEESKEEPKRKSAKQIQREQDIEKFLELLRQGKSRKEAYESVGHDKTWASKVIAELKEKDPDRLKGTSAEIKKDVPVEQAIEAEKKENIIKATIIEEEKKEPTTFRLEVTEKPKQEPTVFELAKTAEQTTQKPQTAAELTQTIKSTPEEEKHVYAANTKPQKAVMGFRADVDKIELWKLYADAAEQEIGAICTAALDEYIHNHELTADQKEIFEIKKQALEAEKRIKSRKKKNS